MKVALSHDWLNGMRGGEKCLEVLCELFPGSPIHTLFHVPGRVSPTIAAHPIRTSFLQRLPGVRTRYRHYLPLYRRAIESFDLRGHDVILSTSHCVAKGVRKPAGAVHICYCFTPVRYAWGLFDEYFGSRSPVFRAVAGHFIGRLKRWDRDSSARVDHFIAISQHVKRRIRDCYGRDAEVVYPPVDTRFYAPDPAVPREGFYLVVSALVPYKRVDLAVQAFTRLGKRLIVIGEGPESAALRRSAGANVRFIGWGTDEVLRDHYRRCRALVFPGEEDFGIVPVEAQACGAPVIARGKGGALETVREGRTGVFFEEPTVEALIEAIGRFESSGWDPAACTAAAAGFSRERFAAEIASSVRRVTR